MKTLLQFLFAAYFFSKGFRKARVISEALHIHPIRVCKWCKSPLWRVATRFWGYTGTDKVTQTAKWEKKQLSQLRAARLDKQKDVARRLAGENGNDLRRAERLWTTLFKNEVTHDTE